MPVARRPRPLLVGESNPYGGDPYFALYPAPDWCSGHRLCCLILKMRRTDYLREFERVNLCSHQWNMKEAKTRAAELFDRSNSLILMGSKVCSAFGVRYAPFELVGVTRLILPHPSGLCRLWNEVGAFARARAAVASFVPNIAHLLGVVDDGRYKDSSQ